jgi:mannose-6-phosphate isomerase-like protein (cupin superfamily)
MYRTNMREVRKVAGLKRKDGWVDMQVQFLIDKASAGADHVIGWTVLKPGARHERHRHHHCDEFFIVLKGHGHIYTDDGETPSGEGDVVYSQVLARLQQHLEGGRRAGVGMDGCRLDRGLRLRGRSGQSLISTPRRPG